MVRYIYNISSMLTKSVGNIFPFTIFIIHLTYTCGIRVNINKWL